MKKSATQMMLAFFIKNYPNPLGAFEMKKYKFIDSQGRTIFVKARSFKNAYGVAGRFMTGPACIGWGPCHG